MMYEKILARNWTRWLVLFFIACYALSFILFFSILRIFLIIRSIPFSVFSVPTMYLFLDVVRVIGAFVLLVSIIGIFFRKRIAYYSAILGLILIGFSGMIISINMKVSFINIDLSSNPIPGDFNSDIFWYVVIPIGFIAYLLYDLKLRNIQSQGC